MRNPAPTLYPIHDLLAERWSPRSISARPVEPAKLKSLLEAARWAPSSSNMQPWRFLVATRDHPEQWQRLFDCMVEWNQGWVRASPVLILSVAALLTPEGKQNHHAHHDTGLATQNLLLQAVAEGLVAHAMAGFNRGLARETLSIPEAYDPVAMIAVGYPAEASDLPEAYREGEARPRERRALNETVFGAGFGLPSPLLQEGAG